MGRDSRIVVIQMPADQPATVLILHTITEPTVHIVDTQGEDATLPASQIIRSASDTEIIRYWIERDRVAENHIVAACIRLLRSQN